MDIQTHIVSCGGIIYNDKKEILLINHPRRGWEFPGGGVSNGETIYEGLIREIKEETGITAKINKLININSVIDGIEGYDGIEWLPTQIIFDFTCTYENGDIKTSNESKEVKWFSKEEALDIINDPITKDRLINVLNTNELTYRVFKINPYTLISEQTNI